MTSAAANPTEADTSDALSPRYQRVLLKISGEAFCKPGEFGIDGQELEVIAREIVLAAQVGAQLGVVVGGGNLYENGELDARPGALEALDVPMMLFSLGHGRIYNRRGELVPRTDAMDRSVVRMLNDKAAFSLARDDSTMRFLRSAGCSNTKRSRRSPAGSMSW